MKEEIKKHNHADCCESKSHLKGDTKSKKKKEDDSCDLDPNKICDNCGKCLNLYNTDEKGFVKIKIDKVDKSHMSLDEMFMMYGLDDEDGEKDCHCHDHDDDDDDCDCDDCDGGDDD